MYMTSVLSLITDANLLLKDSPSHSKELKTVFIILGVLIFCLFIFLLVYKRRYVARKKKNRKNVIHKKKNIPLKKKDSSKTHLNHNYSCSSYKQRQTRDQSRKTRKTNEVIPRARVATVSESIKHRDANKLTSKNNLDKYQRRTNLNKQRTTK